MVSSMGKMYAALKGESLHLQGSKGPDVGNVPPEVPKQHAGPSTRYQIAGFISLCHVNAYNSYS